MALDATARRRWLGAFFLLAALAMLVGGETFLQGRLGAAAFVLYWLCCLLFTGAAIVVAFLDVRALQYRVRKDQRDLFETTLNKIVSDAKNKGKPKDQTSPERPESN